MVVAAGAVVRRCALKYHFEYLTEIIKMKILSAFILCLLCIQLYVFKSDKKIELQNNFNIVSTKENMKMKITIGTHIFNATLYNNATVMSFLKQLPVTINMTELNGNEKYFNLPANLPTHASKPEIINEGDLMLYGSNTLVIFYKTFSTSYSYTKLGSIDETAGLASALGSGDVTVKLELK
jgi:hypothetical protein